MTLTCKESPELSEEQAALAGLLAALTWEHAREKAPDPIQWAPRTIIYAKEAERVLGAVRTGLCHTLHPSVEPVGAEIAALCSGWARNVTFAQAGRATRHGSSTRMWTADDSPQNAALGAHTLIPEDAPELLKVPGPHTEDGGQILDGSSDKTAHRYATRRFQEGQEAWMQFR
jgi:hypothetical protein